MKKLAIANGKYMKDGIEKTKWVNIGIINTAQSGKEYMLLDPTINLAGFPREEGKSSVMVSIFDDNQQQQGYAQQPQQQQQPQQGYGQPQQAQAPAMNVNTDGIPF